MKSLHDRVGNKAASLLALSQFNIPPFFCVTAEETNKMLNEIGISKTFRKEAFRGDKKKRDALRKKILESSISVNLAKLSNLSESIIIRSSALEEDGNEFSFAGIYESKQTRNSPALFTRTFQEVLCEAFSERVYVYCKRIGRESYPDIAFIVQDYIDADYSGVTFTTTRYKNMRGMLIHAVKGPAEKAVRGQDIAEIFVPFANNIFLPETVYRTVVNACKKIEAHFSRPQDIEWCCADGKLFILQSRAITRDIEEEMVVLDNSNIAESYSGIVLPLTCSFAQFIYAQVYRDVAKTSNIGQKKIDENADIFNNLLSFPYGRFYYNMMNWYRMLTLFPGYRRNKINLETMISLRSRMELDKRHMANVSATDVIRYYAHIIPRIITFERDVSNFKKYVNKYLADKSKDDLSTYSLKKLWKRFEQFDENLLRKWSITVDNDFLAMTWFGQFRSLAEKKRLTPQEIVAHISNIHSVVSAQQVERLAKLSFLFQSDKTLMRLANQKKWEDCNRRMNALPEIKEPLDAYLALYGGRFANELKLESPDLESDTSHLPRLLASYHVPNRKNAAAKKVFPSSGTLRIFANKTKHYLRHREELRLLRSQTFSHIRKIFISIGKVLEDSGAIKNRNDIFFLHLSEIKSYVRSSSSINLASIVQERKKMYDTYKSIDLDTVLIFPKGDLPPLKRGEIGKKKQLRGTGCSPGRIGGKVTVFHSFYLPKKPVDIAVVKNTDPGWVPLFGMCKGLIVENGGLLSHAAIVSRELDLPCIIGVENATTILKTGKRITMNGSDGTIIVEGKNATR